MLVKAPRHKANSIEILSDEGASKHVRTWVAPGPRTGSTHNTPFPVMILFPFELGVSRGGVTDIILFE